MSKYPNLLTQRLLKIWMLQSEFSKIIRWSTSLSKPRSEVLRRQTCTEHVLSVEFTARFVIDVYTNITKIMVDRELILDAFHFHDYGEPLKGRDVVATIKQDTDDRDEYLAFMEFTQDLPEPILLKYQRAFLLQFCLDDSDCFPDEAKEIMAKLKKEKHQEAILFKFIENLDYLLYAIEQYQKHGYTPLLMNVLTETKPNFDFCKRANPELFQIFFDPTTKLWIQRFLEQN